jgi:hypothetical protein
MADLPVIPPQTNDEVPMIPIAQTRMGDDPSYVMPDSPPPPSPIRNRARSFIGVMIVVILLLFGILSGLVWIFTRQSGNDDLQITSVELQGLLDKSPIGDDLKIHNDVTIQGVVTLLNDLVVNGSLTVKGETLLARNLQVTGTLTAANFAGSNLTNCDTIDSDADGNLFCGTDETGGSAATPAGEPTLGEDTNGNYVESVATGSGLQGGSPGSEGANLTLSLGPLTADYEQTGAFDIVLADAASELKILESSGATFYGKLDVGDLSANRTHLLPDESGTVCLQNSTDCGFASSGSGVTSLNGLTGDLTLANASGAGSTITIDNAAADGTTKGIAAFNPTNFTTAAGVVNTVQDIAPTSSPTFADLTLSGDLAVDGGDITSSGTLIVSTSAGSIRLDPSSGQVDIDGSLVPLTDNSRTLGNGSALFNALYVNEIYSDGIPGTDLLIDPGLDLHVQLASGDSVVISGATTDITTGTGEDLTLLANGSGQIILNDTTQVPTLGATDSVTYLCRNSSNQLAGCSSAATGAAFVQGGNDFGGTGILGLTSSHDLNVITANLTRLTVQADGDVAFDSDTLFVDAANNRVGIGTGSPAQKLDVVGGNIAFGSGQWVGFNSDNNFGVNSSQVDINSAGHVRINLDTNNNETDRRFAILRDAVGGGGTELFRVQENGNVGIGTTTPTSFKLEVAGNVGPDADNTRDLGSASRRWANIYANNINSSGSITTTGSILPAADDTYDLGSSSLRWRDLYLGPTSLHLQSTAAETTSARDWKFGIQETDGASEGNLRILEGANELLNITPAGNVGIGTTAPGTKLHVAGSSQTQLKVESTAGNSDTNIIFADTSRTWSVGNNIAGIGAGKFNIYDTTAGETRLTIDTDGDVGVGTTTPGAPLEVFSSGANPLAKFSSGAGDGYIQMTSSNANADSAILFENSADAGSAWLVGRDNGNNFNIDYSTGATYGSGTTTTRLAIDTNGNVGIGTTSPAQKLQVGSTSDTSANAVRVATGGGADANPVLSLFSSGTVEWAQAAAGSTYVIAQGPASYTTAALTSAARLAINSSGNVGIGTTDPTLGALQVARTGQSNIVIQGDSDSAGADAGYTGLTLHWTGAEKWLIGRDATGGTDKLIFRRAGSTNDMAIDTSGNVGIGTISPRSRLHVESTTSNDGMITVLNPTEGGEASISFDTGTFDTTKRWVAGVGGWGNTDQFVIGRSTGPALKINTDNTAHLVGNNFQFGNDATVDCNWQTWNICVHSGVTNFGIHNANGANDINLYVDGSVNQNAGDIAEYMAAYGGDNSLPIGTIVAAKGNRQVGISSGKNDPNAIGVVSNPEEASKLFAGDESEDASRTKILVGMAGTLVVRVNGEGGPIAAGDYITSSSAPGVGMKANESGVVVVGRALENWDGTSSTVRVIIYNGAYQPESLQADSSFDNLNVGGLAEITRLVVRDTLVTQTLIVEGHIIGNPDTRGQVTVPAGETQLRHDFTSRYQNPPTVVLTPVNRAVLFRVESDATGFTVFLTEPAPGEIKFNYMVQQ